MSKIVVSLKSNYADEFDLSGLAILDKDVWEEVKTGIPETGALECWFGTNKYTTFRSKADYLSKLTITEITEQEEGFLRKVLGMDNYSITYGLFVVRSDHW